MKFIKLNFLDTALKVGILMIVLLSSCDKGYERMNKNPNAYTEPVIGSLFSASIQRHAGTGDGNTLYPNSKQAGCFVQYFSSLNPWQWTGDKYLYKPDYNDGLWQTAYGTELKETVQIIALTKDDPAMINQHNIARIWKVEILHRVTDLYGDIPYSEAGQGFIEGIYKPKYDKQADVYADMLKELDEAAQALDATKPSYGAADFLYNGNVDQWKRYAYSMMLRLGMRLTNVDPALAETWVKKAIAGGVMQGINDIAKLAHTSASSTNWNFDSRQLQTAEGVPPSAKGKGFSKLNKTFIDYLVANNDPRLPFYSTLWQGNADPAQLPSTTMKDKQKGLPGGYDYSSIKDLIPTWNDEMQAEYSEINIHTIAHLEAPTIFQSYSEVKYLLAEAALRGWTSGSAKTHYEEGLRASMQVQSLYPNAMNISEANAAAAAYLSEHPYKEGSFDEQMKQIHTQYWASLFMNNVEVYANWRRTGYPELTPTNYPGNETGGVIPRRLRYPGSEASLNTANYTSAVQAQGPDLFLTRMWWDKK
jgi:hypothetical protein